MNLSKEFPNLCPVKKWRVRSRSDKKKGIKPGRLYLVEKMADGSFRCECVANQFKNECWHIKEIKEEYDTTNK